MFKQILTENINDIHEYYYKVGDGISNINDLISAIEGATDDELKKIKIKNKSALIKNLKQIQSIWDKISINV